VNGVLEASIYEPIIKCYVTNFENDKYKDTNICLKKYSKKQYCEIVLG